MLLVLNEFIYVKFLQQYKLNISLVFNNIRVTVVIIIISWKICSFTFLLWFLLDGDYYKIFYLMNL